MTDGRTDGPTDRRTDGPTKRVVESRSTRLKNVIYLSSTPNFSYLYFASDEAYFANAEANDFEERLLRARLLGISWGDH